MRTALSTRGGCSPFNRWCGGRCIGSIRSTNRRYFAASQNSRVNMHRFARSCRRYQNADRLSRSHRRKDVFLSRARRRCARAAFANAFGSLIGTVRPETVIQANPGDAGAGDVGVDNGQPLAMASICTKRRLHFARRSGIPMRSPPDRLLAIFLIQTVEPTQYARRRSKRPPVIANSPEVHHRPTMTSRPGALTKARIACSVPL